MSCTEIEGKDRIRKIILSSLRDVQFSQEDKEYKEVISIYCSNRYRRLMLREPWGHRESRGSRGTSHEK